MNWKLFMYSIISYRNISEIFNNHINTIFSWKINCFIWFSEFLGKWSPLPPGWVKVITSQICTMSSHQKGLIKIFYKKWMAQMYGAKVQIWIFRKNRFLLYFFKDFTKIDHICPPLPYTSEQERDTIIGILLTVGKDIYLWKLWSNQRPSVNSKPIEMLLSSCDQWLVGECIDFSQIATCG